ncbi:MAG: 5-(carboxyamino)imidazole ribonucleotide mutase [Candidatus Tectomicrobia bacterium]|uniref:N5-carboxyaminoimidazole ribonucleotide mutase n=1 Tax=Tectimicrobiota bacterium TaxID=2528274 RepID=A0A932CKW2_UNCTE|nr:5-(carboxyamino)imidazole ribonucleotide mutase [Candidatus Tectomicrobia bacterium]
MGSPSDLPVMEEAAGMLDSWGIPYELFLTSAHRSPRRTFEYARTARQRGLRVLIVGAGGAAHLAGVIAAETTLPVIGVPIDSSPLKGWDALLSIVQMPGGVPVATMAVGKAGAKNAAIFAAQIFALSCEETAQRLSAFKEEQARQVEEQGKGIGNRAPQRPE